MYESIGSENSRYSLIIEQMEEAYGFFNWVVTDGLDADYRAREAIERIATKFWVIGKDAHGAQFDLRLLTPEEAEEIVNAIVFSACGETKLALNDLVLFSLVLSVFHTTIMLEEHEVEDSLDSDGHRGLVLKEEHLRELWPWDRLFIQG
ncbi:hypothetical protein [Vibrio mediterranei]|uniref:hypothetical protein n=1 Tax=Vibrio mediterranei TaxID=689 RepID=UPI0022846D05|nr:hypothetical protein [Vibrio mediterranei]MCY9853082.1 hypothetical protein [Vibrio mediterranei]